MYGSKSLGLLELATTLERLNCFRSEHWRGYKRKLLIDHTKGERCTVEVQFAEMTEIAIVANERTLHVSFQYLLIFGRFLDKNKARFQKHRQLIWCFLPLFYMYSVISASVINIVPFIEVFDRLRKYLSLSWKLSITCNLRTLLTLLLSMMASI